MGRFFQLPYIKEDSVAQKVVTRYGGLETPRNSMELPVETFYGLYAGRDSKLYPCQSINSPKKKCCSTEAPMKKLISEEISKRSNTRPNAPSIVARLMGVDMLPVDSGQEPKMVGRTNETPAGKFMEKEQSRKGSDGHDSLMWESSQQHDLDYLDQNFDSYSDHCNSHVKLRKPQRREHPQEEELQKFKKEFEAWQAARFMECSKVVEFSNSPSQTTSQDELNKESNFCSDNPKRIQSFDNLMEPKDLPVRLRETPASRSRGKKRDYLLDGMEESFYSNRMSKTDIQPSHLTNSDRRSDIVSAPTKIVILRPGPDRISVNEDSWNSTTPSTFEERGSIQDFLEEVKERLKSEMQGKSSKKSTTVRGRGIETPYREKPSEPRQIAQRIAQQVRDSVTEDFGVNLLRSESTRSYRSDNQLNGTDSPEFVNRETRKLLTERLRNVLKGEPHREVPMVSHKRVRSSVLYSEKSKAGQSRDILIKNKMGCSESSMNDLEKQSRSFREASDVCGMHCKEPSPRNLVRSLSAPVSASGTSFGKLLLEDRHIFTGAQIRMKHEVVENVSMDVKKQKDKFKIREKVSSFGYSLTLRGRLFRRRVQSVDELHYNCDDLLKDIASGPTVMMSSYETHENSTEVPPSPASVCSSVDDEFWRPAVCSSPASTGADQLEEDSEVPDVFGQINSNLNDLRKQLDQLESPALEESITEEKSNEVEIEIKDPTEAYVRDLLVASGNYDGSCNRSLSRWDPLGKPISNQAFEEVEESYRQSTKVDESSTKDEGARIHHRVIFDLLNEALPSVLRQPANMSKHGKTIDSAHHQPPHGRELLSLVWEIIRSYVHPQPDRSCFALDSLLAQDLKSDPWFRLLDDDINSLGKDLECHITGDLIEEIVEDIYSSLLT